MQHLTFPEYAQAIKTGIVVVDFYAQRCHPCKVIAPHLEELAKSTEGKATFYKVDVDAQNYLAGVEGIRAMPTMKIYNNGVMVEEIVGVDLERLHKTLVSLIK